MEKEGSGEGSDEFGDFLKGTLELNGLGDFFLVRVCETARYEEGDIIKLLHGLGNEPIKVEAVGD